MPPEPFDPPDRLCQPVGEERLVREAGDRIVIGEIVALRLRLPQCRDVHGERGDAAIAHAPLRHQYPAAVGEPLDGAAAES